MDIKINIKEEKTKIESSVAVEFKDCTVAELITLLKDIAKEEAIRKEILIQLGEPAEAENKKADTLVILPYGIITVNKEMLKKRFDLIGLSRAERKTFTPFSENYERKEIVDLIFIGINGINSHFTNVFKRIGKFEDRELREMLTCDEAIYFIKYFHRIENCKREYDITYKKKTEM